jgi:hypothetical protein
MTFGRLADLEGKEVAIFHATTREIKYVVTINARKILGMKPKAEIVVASYSDKLASKQNSTGVY